MKLRKRLIVGAGLVVVAIALDTAAWFYATRALRQTVQAWAARQRTGGLDVTLAEPLAGGWPFAATLRFGARLGPAGMPAGATVDAALTSSVSATRPTLVRTAVRELRIETPDAATLMATAASWIVDFGLSDPGRATTEARDLLVAWARHAATIGSLTGAVSTEAAGDPGGLGVTLLARDIDLGQSGLALPAATGEVVRSLDLQAVIHGGLPPAATSVEASMRDWRDAGGQLEFGRLAISYGPADATFAGRLGLDTALRPAGSGMMTTRGLSPLLELLGSSGAIPPHTALAARGVLGLFSTEGDGAVAIPVGVADGRIAVAGFPVAKLPPVTWANVPAPVGPLPQQGQ